MFVVQDWNGPGKGHYSSRTQINAGAKTGPLFESSTRPLLKSGMRPLNRYGTRHKTINRRPEQMFSPSDTGLEWLGEGPLYKPVSNKCQGVQTAATIQIMSWAIIEIWHGALGQIL